MCPPPCQRHHTLRAAAQHSDGAVSEHPAPEQSSQAQCTAHRAHPRPRTRGQQLLAGFDFSWKETKGQRGREPHRAPGGAAVRLGRGPRLPTASAPPAQAHEHGDVVLFQGILLFHQLLLLRSETETQYVISWMSAKLTSSHVLTEEKKGSV